jgi:hypothetical protein
MNLGLEVFLLSGRLDGWDNDHAQLVVAPDSDRAREFFVAQTLLADNGYAAGDREVYVNQQELIGWLNPDGTMRFAHNVLKGYPITT